MGEWITSTGTNERLFGSATPGVPLDVEEIARIGSEGVGAGTWPQLYFGHAPIPEGRRPIAGEG